MSLVGMSPRAAANLTLSRIMASMTTTGILSIAIVSLVALSAATLYIMHVDNRRRALAEADYRRMQDRHIGNALAAMHASYRHAPARAASGQPASTAQEIRNARARYLLAQYRRDGLPY
jgi:hypothetical protein